MLDEDRNESLQELENIKREIDENFERLNKLVNKDKNKIENKYKEIKERVETDIVKRKKVESTLAASINILQNERLNEVYKFVQILNAESGMKSLEATALVTFDDLDFEKMHYERDKALVSKLQAINNLGYIDGEKQVYTVSSSRNIKVLEKQQKKSNITGICQIDEKLLVLADWKNSCLKILDTSEEIVKCSIELDYSPFDICNISERKIAVTLLHGKKVAIYSRNVFDILQFQSSIDTVEKCRGIAFFSSELYIACGGGGTKNEGLGHIRVCSLDGKLIKTILHGGVTMSLISRPWKIRFHPTTPTAFVTDERNIFTVNTQTKYELGIFASTDNQGNSNQSLCFDTAGRVLVSNYKSKSVDILSAGGKRMVPLLTTDSLPSKPKDLAFDTSTSRLYIGMEDSAFVLCFDLEEIKWKTAPSF